MSRLNWEDCCGGTTIEELHTAEGTSLRAVSFSCRMAGQATALLVGMAWVQPASARPNTHGIAISTWDARASSVSLSVHRAVQGQASYQALSAVTNFSSSSGLLSAQFGVHYLTFHEQLPKAPEAQGASLGGAALLHFPFEDALAGFLPSGSFNLYVGGLPTMLVGIERNYLSLPLVAGVGIRWSPAQSLSVTPWAEVSRSVNLDTQFQAVNTDEAVDAARDGELTQEEVETLVRDGLDLEVVSKTATRLGLNASFHLSRRTDLDLNFVVGSGSTSSLGIGAAIVIRWDEFVGPTRTQGAESLAPRHDSRLPLQPPRPQLPQQRMAPDGRRRVAPARRVRPRSRQVPVSSAVPSAAPLKPAVRPSKKQLRKQPKRSKPTHPNRTRRRPRLRVIPQP